MNLFDILKAEKKEAAAFSPRWQAAKKAGFDDPKGIHIWKINWTDISSKQYLQSLSEAEYQRIFNYQNPVDRNKRIMSRGILRELSAKYLKTNPKNLNYTSNTYGKPFLTDEYAHLQFNISHSTDYILLAFAFTGQPIGIDIEKINVLFNHLDIADQYFAASEKESLDCQRPSEQFFKIWTRKEALIKALGAGINEAFFQIDVLKDKINLTKIGHSDLYLKTFLIEDTFLSSLAAPFKLSELQFYTYS